MIYQNSRNTLTSVIQITDPITEKDVQPSFVDIRERVVTRSASDVVTPVSASRGLAHIANERLGDPRHWWIIADLSGIVDPFEVTTGDSVVVPSTKRLLLDILGG